VLQALGSNQALDLGSLGVWLRALFLGLDFASNDEFTDLEKKSAHQTQPISKVGEEM
jgi:hypothetical protein